MRTIHFVETYLQLTETFVYNFIKSSATCGDVAVVSFSWKNLGNFPLDKGIKIFKLPAEIVISKRKLYQIPWFLFDLVTGKKRWYRRLNQIIKEFRPDIVHCHFGTVGVDFAGFKRYYKSKIPFITSFYGYDASELPKRDLKYKDKLERIWEDATYILSEGPQMNKKLENLGAPSYKLRLSPIVVDSRNYPRKMSYRRSGQLKFLLIGRFVEKKGFHLFLESVGRIKDEIGDFSIQMIGGGIMKPVYLSIIKKFNLEEHTDFLGPKSLQECIQYMLDADVMIHPSVTSQSGDSEGGAPTILIEAQLIGLPVISSAHADIPFIMGYKDYLAKEGDVSDLIRLILLFIRDSDIINKMEAGRSLVMEQHELNRSMHYKNILAEFNN